MQPQNGQDDNSVNASEITSYKRAQVAGTGIQPIRRALFWLTAKLPVEPVYRLGMESGSEPYMERYSLVLTRKLTIYLHRFLADPKQTHFAHYPWRCVAIRLCGSYSIRNLVLSEGGEVESKVGFVTVSTSDHFHKLTTARPDTWSLFMHFEREIDHIGYLHGLKDDQASFTQMPDSHQMWHLKSKSAVQTDSGPADKHVV